MQGQCESSPVSKTRKSSTTSSPISIPDQFSPRALAHCPHRPRRRHNWGCSAAENNHLPTPYWPRTAQRGHDLAQPNWPQAPPHTSSVLIQHPNPSGAHLSRSTSLYRLAITTTSHDKASRPNRRFILLILSAESSAVRIRMNVDRYSWEHHPAFMRLADQRLRSAHKI